MNFRSPIEDTWPTNLGIILLIPDSTTRPWHQVYACKEPVAIVDRKDPRWKKLPRSVGRPRLKELTRLEWTPRFMSTIAIVQRMWVGDVNVLITHLHTRNWCGWLYIWSQVSVLDGSSLLFSRLQIIANCVCGVVNVIFTEHQCPFCGFRAWYAASHGRIIDLRKWFLASLWCFTPWREDHGARVF